MDQFLRCNFLPEQLSRVYLFIAKAENSDDLPRFMWTLCPETNEVFDQCLEVDFPKDKSSDIALLHYVDGETTILRGDLMDESTVHVSVTVEQSVLTVKGF